MAHTLDLDVQPRSVLGKKVKQLRRTGIIPANVFGHGVASTAVQVDVKSLEGVLRQATATTLINLRVGSGDPRAVVLRDVRWGLLKRVPEHVDFFAIRLDEKMRAQVPLVLRGEAPAAKVADLMLYHPLTHLNVVGLPGLLPEFLAVDISGLAEADQAIHARDLRLPDGVELLDDPDEIVVRVQVTRAAVEAAPAADAAAPADATAEKAEA